MENWIVRAIEWVFKKIFSNGSNKVIEAQTKVWEELIKRKDRIIEEYEKKKEISNGEKDRLITELKEERIVMKMLQEKYNKINLENQRLKEQNLFNKRRSMYE